MTSWAESRDRMASDQTDAYRAELDQQGRQPSYENFEMRIVEASPDLAQRLGVEEGDSLVCRAIERHVDGDASSLQESYYPMDIAQECGPLTPRDIPKGTIRTMADHGYVEVGYVEVGYVEVGYVDEITTRMPTPDEARKLGLGTGTPALVYVRTAHTTERPIRLVVTIFAGDRNRIVYELGDLSAYDGDQ